VSYAPPISSPDHPDIWREVHIMKFLFMKFFSSVQPSPASEVQPVGLYSGMAVFLFL